MNGKIVAQRRVGGSYAGPNAQRFVRIVQIFQGGGIMILGITQDQANLPQYKNWGRLPRKLAKLFAREDELFRFWGWLVAANQNRQMTLAAAEKYVGLRLSE
jgi:hypothetical protein